MMIIFVSLVLLGSGVLSAETFNLFLYHPEVWPAFLFIFLFVLGIGLLLYLLGKILPDSSSGSSGLPADSGFGNGD